MKLYSYSPHTTPKIKEIELVRVDFLPEGMYEVNIYRGFKSYATLETLLKDPQYAKSPKEAIEKHIEIQKSIIQREQKCLELALKDLEEMKE